MFDFFLIIILIVVAFYVGRIVFGLALGLVLFILAGLSILPDLLKMAWRKIRS